MFRGASDLLEHDLSLAFAGRRRRRRCRADLSGAADSARRAIDDYATELESKVLPSATGS